MIVWLRRPKGAPFLLHAFICVRDVAPVGLLTVVDCPTKAPSLLTRRLIWPDPPLCPLLLGLDRLPCDRWTSQLLWVTLGRWTSQSSACAGYWPARRRTAPRSRSKAGCAPDGIRGLE